MLSQLEESHYVILFKEGYDKRQIKGVYEKIGSEYEKVCGDGPDIISENMIQLYYRYNASSKEFKKVNCDSKASAIDAIKLYRVS